MASKLFLGLAVLACVASCSMASRQMLAAPPNVVIASDGSCKVLDAQQNLITRPTGSVTIRNLPALGGGRAWTCSGSFSGTGAALPSAGIRSIVFTRANSGFRQCTVNGATTNQWSNIIGTSGLFSLTCYTPA